MAHLPSVLGGWGHLGLQPPNPNPAFRPNGARAPRGRLGWLVILGLDSGPASPGRAAGEEASKPSPLCNALSDSKPYGEVTVCREDSVRGAGKGSRDELGLWVQKPVGGERGPLPKTSSWAGQPDLTSRHSPSSLLGPAPNRPLCETSPPRVSEIPQPPAEGQARGHRLEVAQRSF